MELELKKVTATAEPRARHLRYIRHYLPELSDNELRLVLAFIRGIRKVATT